MIWQNLKTRPFDRSGVKNTGAESDSAFRACLHDRNDDCIGIHFQENVWKPFAIRAFEPPWGKRKAPAFVSKAGTYYGGELGIRTLGGLTLTAFRVLSVEHHFEENKERTEKLREDKNTNNSLIFRLFSVKNRGVSRVRMNHANLLKNGHFGEI